MSELFKKLISIILLVIILLLFLSFLKNTQNVDSFAYVVAIGLDKGSNNNLKITFQTLAPTTTSSSSSSSEESDSSSSGNKSSSSVLTTSIECASINSGIQLLNGYIGSKQLNLSHCQSIIFSEELAYEGLSKYIYTFINDAQIRHDTNIIISKCNAEYYLNNSESVYEKLISKYYNVSPTSGKYTGYTHDINIVKFFCNLNNTFVDPTAILSSINIPETKLNNIYDDNYLKDSTFKAGQSPINSKHTGMEDVGIAVFKNDKLIGELTAIETIAYLMTINEFENCELTILNPFDKESTIDFSLSKQNNTKNTVKFVNGSPYISTEVYLNAKILSMDKNNDYIDNNILTELEYALNSYIENILYEYLYKISMEYGTDISGFGKYAIPKFLTTADWNNYNWNKNFENSFFKVNVSTKLDSSNILLKT